MEIMLKRKPKKFTIICVSVDFYSILLLFIFINIISVSFVDCFATCPSAQLISSLLLNPKDSDKLCDCSQIQEGGWEITCLSEVNLYLDLEFEPTVPTDFFVRYEVGRQVRITCDNGEPAYKPALFQDFGIESIDSFILENCPLPESFPLSDIFYRTSTVSSIQAKTSKVSSELSPNSETNGNSENISEKPEISKVRSLSITVKNSTSHKQLSNLFSGLETIEYLKLTNFLINDIHVNFSATNRSDISNNTLSVNKTSASIEDEEEVVPPEQNVFRFSENFPNLKTLILKSFLEDSVPGVLFDMLKGLTKLEYLELDSNDLSTFPDSPFKSSGKSLKKLYLYHNKISKLAPNAFSNLTQLEFLDLSHNIIRELAPDLFKDLKNLNYLSVKNNLMSKLAENIFQYNTKLKSIDLSANRNLKIFPTNLLKGLNNLANFTAEDCLLTQISKNAHNFFRNAPNLQTVKVRGNKLTNLTINGLFSGNPKLNKLDFSYNEITQISRDIFSSNSSQLTELNFYGNEVQLLPENLFLQLRNLRKLNFGFNSLRETSPQLFLPLKNLEELNLSKNKLVTINSKQSRIPFGLGPMLRKVNLAHNQLSNFEDDFNSINWSLYLNIADLDLKNNSFDGIFRVPVFSASNAPIIYLDLSYNKFTAIDVNNVVNYDQILLDYSKSEEYSTDDSRHTRESKTNIWETHIKLDNNPINCDCFLEPFLNYVKKTQMSTYPIRSSNGLYRKSIFIVETEELLCETPIDLKGKPVNHLELSQLVCQILDTNICPKSCDCSYQSAERTAIIDCDRRELKSLPQELVLSRFSNITLDNITNSRIETINGVIVSLKHNSIENIENINHMFIWDNKLIRKPSFVEVWFDNNSISVVHEDIIPQFYSFKNGSLPLIRVLSFRDNRISSFPLSVLKSFDSFASHLNDNSIAEPKLFLGNNPYDCHNEKALPGSVCQIRDFKSWLTSHYERIADLSAIKCESISHNSSSTIIEIPDDVLCPTLHSKQNDKLLLAMTVVCIILAISLFIVSVLYYRNKQTILAFIYIHFNPIFICLSFSEHDLDEDKVYDAFVSYSSADRDVIMSLIEKLEKPNNEANLIMHNTTGASIHEGLSDQIIPENEFKKSQMNLSINHNSVQTIVDNSVESDEQFFKLCIHERDWLPGNLISWNIVNSVQNSKRTILVLSKDFIESIWFQVEFHTAYYQMLEDKIDRLIVVVKGQLPPKEELDKDLVFLLTTKTYLVWGEKWFWEKLRYALPHKKISNNQFKSPDNKSVNPIPSKTMSFNSNKNSVNNKSTEAMKDYCDKTIANHFHLNSYTNNSQNNSKPIKTGPKSLRNSSTVLSQTDSRQKIGLENQSFVDESHT